MLHAGIGHGTEVARRGAVPSPKMASDLGFPVRHVPLCYPAPTMAQSRLTKAEVGSLRAQLLGEKEELAAQLTSIEEETFAATQSEMNGDVGLDDEVADAGTSTFEREKDLSIENNVRDLLQKIERALERIDAGTYGVCERCGKTIPKARIKALPYADLCIDDAQARSRR
jgi:DnaK suppressor protein